MKKNAYDFCSGLYIIRVPPPSVGFGDGKKSKKENLGKIKLLTVLNHKNYLVKHNLTQLKP